MLATTKKNSQLITALSLFVAPLLFASGQALAQDYPVVQMIKRNASAYAIDGSKDAENRQDVYLWSETASNVNQQWYEIDRGNGYYSYQKLGTNHCIDGNGGGENTQNVYLWQCGANNYNQHWLKVDTGGGYYRLQKRNAPGYSIDGNNSGSNGQSIYLWTSSDSNRNQQWSFNYLSGSPTNTGSMTLEGEIRQHDFDNGKLEPFTECTVKSPNYVKVVSKRVKVYWEAAAYNGSRVTRGAEFCELGRSVDPEIELRTKKHYWSGFTLNIHKDHSRTSDSAIAQTMGYKNWDNDNAFNTWSLLLSITNGDLVVNHRPGAGTPTTHTIVEDFSFGVNHDIVIGQVFSGNNDGMVEIWVDGKRLYKVSGINNGMGPFDDDDYQGEGSHSAFKLGMYNHTPDDYKDGETRIVYYDNVTWYTGPEGYDIVAP